MTLWARGREGELVCSIWYPGNTKVLTKDWAQTEAGFVSVEKRVPKNVHTRQMDKPNLSEHRGFPG